MPRIILSLVCLVFALSACTSQSWDESSRRYAEWVTGKKAPQQAKSAEQVTRDKQRVLAQLNGFDFDKRYDTYVRLSKVAQELWKSPKKTIVMRKNIEIDGKDFLLELLNRDLVDGPDMFVFHTDGGSDQAFGFMFDLNGDGLADYLVLNGGIVFDRDKKPYWMNYHWIDSNYDGRIDIMTNNAVSLNSDVKLPQKGLTAWVYDMDFDGYIDTAEYLGPDTSKPAQVTNGIGTVNWALRDKKFGGKKWPISHTLEYINSALRQ